jgi:hypothetical protein
LKKRQEHIVKRIALVVAAALGLYLTIRAVVELFIIHWADPASYRSDWGGPSLAGVLAVHCIPGLILPGYLAWRINRKRGPDEIAETAERRAGVPHRPWRQS